MQDVLCKQQVGLPSLWYGLIIAHQQALIDQHQQQLEQARDALVGIVRRAAALLGVPPPG